MINMGNIIKCAEESKLNLSCAFNIKSNTKFYTCEKSLQIITFLLFSMNFHLHMKITILKLFSSHLHARKSHPSVKNWYLNYVAIKSY